MWLKSRMKKEKKFKILSLWRICVHLVLSCMYQMTYYIWFNPLTPNDDYSGRTAPLTSKRFILYIYSTHKGTEYFKHGIFSFSLQNAVCFIILTHFVPVLFTFYIQGVPKLKKNNFVTKRLILHVHALRIWKECEKFCYYLRVFFSKELTSL